MNNRWQKPARPGLVSELRELAQALRGSADHLHRTHTKALDSLCSAVRLKARPSRSSMTARAITPQDSGLRTQDSGLKAQDSHRPTGGAAHE